MKHLFSLLVSTAFFMGLFPLISSRDSDWIRYTWVLTSSSIVAKLLTIFTFHDYSNFTKCLCVLSRLINASLSFLLPWSFFRKVAVLECIAPFPTEMSLELGLSLSYANLYVSAW